MALTADTLVTVFSGSVTGIHLYSSADAIGTIVGSGYFNAVTSRLRNGDIILVAGAIGGTQTVDAIVVTSATEAATVTTTNGT